MLRLPELVASPLSINAVREDLQNQPQDRSRVAAGVRATLCDLPTPTVRRPPPSAPVKKEQKHYHLDWSVVPAEAARFENLVACHLLKWNPP